MKSTFVIAVALAALAASAGAGASEELAKKSGCLGCHNVQGAKKMGASFKDLSAKHKDKVGAEAALIEKLTGAKGHPGVKASPDEVKTLVQWVLAM